MLPTTSGFHAEHRPVIEIDVNAPGAGICSMSSGPEWVPNRPLRVEVRH